MGKTREPEDRLPRDPRHVIHYTSNDEVRREFSIVVTARPVCGDLTPSAESREVRWVHPAELGNFTMDKAMRKRVTNYLEHPGAPALA